MVKTAHHAGDWAAHEYVGHDSANHGYDEKLTNVEGSQDPQLVSGVEHESDNEYPPTSLRAKRKSRRRSTGSVMKAPKGAGRPSRASLRSARIARMVTTVGMTNNRKFNGPLKRPSSCSNPRDSMCKIVSIVHSFPLSCRKALSCPILAEEEEPTHNHGISRTDRSGRQCFQTAARPGLR